MQTLTYHAGQLAIQDEAKTTYLAEKLAGWIGPVAEYARGADLVLLAYRQPDDTLGISVLSGAAPLMEIVETPVLRLRFPSRLWPQELVGERCGGLVINLSQARRARLNGELSGVLSASDGAMELTPTEAFTFCRKYLAPSLALEQEVHCGPTGSEALGADDPWLRETIARAETTFLASISPAGMPDVAHRGGVPGFLRWHAATGTLSWPEYVGDGVFKSAGNVRATGVMTLLVPDLDSGDAIELSGHGEYVNTRSERGNRLDPLVQHREPFPIQGEMRCAITRTLRLRQLLHPRQRLERALRVTSASAIQEQAPQ